jgi:uncharacterized protein YqgC (DUF456 family)
MHLSIALVILKTLLDSIIEIMFISHYDYKRDYMTKKWTKNLAIGGQIIGMFFGTTQNSYWMNSIADFANIVGHGIPFAIIGALIGLVIDYFAKSKPPQ